MGKADDAKPDDLVDRKGEVEKQAEKVQAATDSLLDDLKKLIEKYQGESYFIIVQCLKQNGKK